jgi:uncharacterized protein
MRFALLRVMDARDPTGQPGPVPRAERIGTMDALRGFALAGIFAVNIEWFSRPWQQLGQGFTPTTNALDHLLQWLVYLGAYGKFITLFALLFGMGFAVMAERAAADDRGFLARYLRRSAFLLLVGMAHAALLWSGDILQVYAVASLGLLLAPRLSANAQLALGIGGYLLLSLWYLMPWSAHAQASAEAAQAAANVYMQGDYLDVTRQRIADYGFLLTRSRDLVLLALCLFLIGGWLVRSGRLRDVAGHRAFFVRLLAAGLVGGTALTFASLMPGGPSAAMWLQAALLLALACVALFALLHAWRPQWAPLVWLAAVGRMALTNYLLQSAIASTLFFGYGFGLWGRFGYSGQLLVVVLVFAAQLLLSRWWLARFRFGPVEWLWRWCTYGVRPRMRVVAPPLHLRHGAA